MSKTDTHNPTANKPPIFKSEAEERAFWETHDSSDYVDWDKAQPAVFPNLKPSNTESSGHLVPSDHLKLQANQLGG